MDDVKSKNIYSYLIHIILIIFCVIIIALTIEIINLKENCNKNFYQLQKGFEINYLNVNSFDKDTTILDLSNKYVLLFFYTSYCPFCKENITYWNFLNQKYKEKIDIVGIGMGEYEMIKKFNMDNRCSFFTFYTDRKEFRQEYGISGVPQTILIEKGIVEEVWIGLLNDELIKNIMNSIESLLDEKNQTSTKK